MPIYIMNTKRVREMEITSLTSQIQTSVLSQSVKATNSGLEVILATLQKTQELQSQVMQEMGVGANIDTYA
jgi:hypothetical protein